MALIIDDELQVRRFLRAGLELEGFVVHDFATGALAIDAVARWPIDLVILDVDLPDMNAAQVVDRLRAWSRAPIIILSVGTGEDENVRLLELGADDYVVKPFSIADLLVRVRTALRRELVSPAGASVVTVGAVRIDLVAHMITVNGRAIQLSPKEYRLIHVLAQHAGTVVTHRFLLKEVWGIGHLDDAHYLRILVRKLRQKIEAVPTQPKILVTDLGVGYRLAVDTEHPSGVVADTGQLIPRPLPHSLSGPRS
jgi:two-component system KDP operon response regulator KdpE